MEGVQILWTVKVDIPYFFLDLGLHFVEDISVGDTVEYFIDGSHILKIIISICIKINQIIIQANNLMQAESAREMQTVYDKVIPEHCQKSFFTSRVTKLRTLQDKQFHHMLQIGTTQLRKYPIIIYKQKAQYFLSDLIENKEELLPTEIKSIIWQITKFMIQCQKMNINHLRLFPKAIVLYKKYKQGQPIFLKIKDFSMGKEFTEVSEGKHLQFFQFLHPELSVMNRTVDFSSYRPNYDIWSLGIILYYLIYGKSPFCKQKKDIFSKTILRKYQNKDYQILYTNDKYKSINIFIAKCLELKSEENSINWHTIKKYILDQEQIYNQLDFHNDSFQQMCELYIRLMVFFSGMYCLINEKFEVNNHQFWNKNKKLKNKLCEFTLMFMKLMKKRFQTIYSSYFFLISKQFSDKINLINKCFTKQLEHQASHQEQIIFLSNGFTVEGIKKVQQICIQLKLEISELSRMPYGRRTINRQMSRNNFLGRNTWKSIQTLYDYIDEILFILNLCKTRLKTIYQQFFLSEAFAAILIEDFEYKQVIKIDVRNFLENIVK